MFSKIYTAQINLLEGSIVTVETDISRGLYNFTIVGLADRAIDEARERIASALKHSGIESPRNKNQKITMLLSPADQKKEGTYFDVALALGYALSSEAITFDPKKKLFIGELGLGGDIRPVRGILPIVQTALKLGFEEIYVPIENANEASLIEGITVYATPTLKSLIEHLNTKTKTQLTAWEPESRIQESKIKRTIDMSDIRGQDSAKRGLTIAAAGRHNIALYGPPGTGKTMLARAFTTLLPELSLEEALVVTGIHSIAGAHKEGSLIYEPPFRSPHNTSSHVAIIGGGINLKPGEVTLAHNGVLFLDEFPEFDRRTLESLRMPIEDNVVHIARAKGTALFPSNFILIVAFNPCPCGYFGSKDRPCICSAHEIERYKKKVSGPIADRIDMWVSVGTLDLALLQTKGSGDSSDTLRERVEYARARQEKRFAKNPKIKTNSDMGVRDIDEHIALDNETKKILHDSATRLNLSPRAYHRVKKLARTIADLADSDTIKKEHILEALFFRPRQT